MVGGLRDLTASSTRSKGARGNAWRKRTFWASNARLLELPGWSLVCGPISLGMRRQFGVRVTQVKRLLRARARMGSRDPVLVLREQLATVVAEQLGVGEIEVPADATLLIVRIGKHILLNGETRAAG